MKNETTFTTAAPADVVFVNRSEVAQPVEARRMAGEVRERTCEGLPGHQADPSDLYGELFSGVLAELAAVYGSSHIVNRKGA